MLQIVTRRGPVAVFAAKGSDKVLVAYYAATVVFLLLDVLLDINVRVAFLESLPLARMGYMQYSVVRADTGLELNRPVMTAEGEVEKALPESWDGAYR